MEDTDRDFFMSATEAKEYGLIDTVIEHPTDVAVRSSGIPLYAGEVTPSTKPNINIQKRWATNWV